MDLIDEDIQKIFEHKIEELKNKIKETEEHIARYKRAIEVLSGGIPQKNIQEIREVPEGKTSDGIVPTRTVKAVLIDIFKNENRPLTVKEVLSRYIETTGKDVPYNSFSGHFSSLMSKQNLFKKHVILQNPIERRYYYGLPEWFEGDFLNEEYSKKIETT